MADCVLYRGDCLEVMPNLAPGSVAMVFADLPYQTTACKWDVNISPDCFWQSLSCLVYPSSILAFTATLRFLPILMQSIRHPLKYDLVWSKTRSSGFLNATNAPLRAHENILVFGTPASTYNVQMKKTARPRRGDTFKKGEHGKCYGGMTLATTYTYGDERYPTSILSPESPASERGLHPTQKPIALLEWLVKTYSNPGDTVLDPTFGSNTTGVACARVGRNYIGIEKDEAYFQAGHERVSRIRTDMGLPEAKVYV